MFSVCGFAAFLNFQVNHIFLTTEPWLFIPLRDVLATDPQCQSRSKSIKKKTAYLHE